MKLCPISYPFLCRWQFQFLGADNGAISREFFPRDEPSGTLGPAPDGLPAPCLLPLPPHLPPHPHHLQPPGVPWCRQPHPLGCLNCLGAEPKAAGQPSHQCQRASREAAININDNVVASASTKVTFSLIKSLKMVLTPIESLRRSQSDGSFGIELCRYSPAAAPLPLVRASQLPKYCHSTSYLCYKNLFPVLLNRIGPLVWN